MENELGQLGVNGGFSIGQWLNLAFVTWLLASGTTVYVVYRLIRRPRRDKPKRDEFED
ncbi:MAG: hypothetical protein IPM16_18725 [Chloroflexi bacterium]|nr:hypothetical protein [Chloroflexota bacterium]